MERDRALQARPRTARNVILLTGVLLIAANLRASLTVVGPLLGTISHRFGLSGTEAGLLNTLPLLAFAAFSTLALRISQRIGIERTLLAAMLLLTCGIAARSLPFVAALYGGTIVLGIAIAVANVLLPVVVKQRYPAHQSVMTGVYVTMMGLTGAIASGVAVPLAAVAPGGWRTAFGSWAVLALTAAVLWLPQTKHAGERRAAPRGPETVMPWRSLLAWQVTAFFGLQSFGFYVIIGWLPVFLRAHGISAHDAGYELLGFQIASLLVSLTLPLLINRQVHQGRLACASAICCAIAYIGLGAAPGLATVWVLIAGVGAGSCFVLALSFLALRARHPGHTAALSAMAQSIGYLFAATGPIVFGYLYDLTGSWDAPVLMLLVTALGMAAVGIGAGRPDYV